MGERTRFSGASTTHDSEVAKRCRRWSRRRRSTTCSPRHGVPEEPDVLLGRRRRQRLLDLAARSSTTRPRVVVARVQRLARARPAPSSSRATRARGTGRDFFRRVDRTRSSPSARKEGLPARALRSDRRQRVLRTATTCPAELARQIPRTAPVHHRHAGSWRGGSSTPRRKCTVQRCHGQPTTWPIDGPEPVVAARDAEADTAQAAGSQRPEELAPERLRLGLADVSVPITSRRPVSLHGVADHQALLAHGAALADRLDLAVEPRVALAALERALAEHAHLLIERRGTASRPEAFGVPEIPSCSTRRSTLRALTPLT